MIAPGEFASPGSSQEYVNFKVEQSARKTRYAAQVIKNS
jgi:hypothetical protein